MAQNELIYSYSVSTDIKRIPISSNENIVITNKGPGTLLFKADSDLASGSDPTGTSVVSGGTSTVNAPVEFISVVSASNSSITVQKDESNESDPQQQIDEISQELEKFSNTYVYDETNVSIRVKNQNDADILQESIYASTDNPINVSFEQGVFYLDNITLDATLGDKDINFYASAGKEAIIRPKSDVYTPDDQVDATSTHWICDLKSAYQLNDIVMADSKVVYVTNTKKLAEDGVNRNAQDEVEVFDDANNICRIKMPDELLDLELTMNDLSHSKIWLYSSWVMNSYEITNVDSEYIYFYTEYRNTYLNGDWSSMGIRARFFLTNVYEALEVDEFGVFDDKIYIPKSCKELVIGNSTRAFSFSEYSQNASILFSGVEFQGGLLGLAQGGQAITDDGMVYIYNCKNIKFSDCKAYGIDSKFIQCDSSGDGRSGAEYITENISIKRCTGSYIGDGFFRGRGKDILVENCKLDHVGIIKLGSRVLHFTGDNHIAQDNYLYEFPHVGITSDHGDNEYNNGVFQRNVLHCDPNRNLFRDALNDYGAITTGWGNSSEKLYINDNVIFNIYCGGECHGIYGDQGAINTNYEGNLIFNVTTYTVYSRYVSSVYNSCSGITLKNNILLGKYLIGSNPDNQYVTETNRNIIRDIDERNNSIGNNVVVVNEDYKDYSLQSFGVNDKITSKDIDNYGFDIDNLISLYLQNDNSSDTIIKKQNVNGTNLILKSGGGYERDDDAVYIKYPFNTLNINRVEYPTSGNDNITVHLGQFTFVSSGLNQLTGTLKVSELTRNYGFEFQFSIKQQDEGTRYVNGSAINVRLAENVYIDLTVYLYDNQIYFYLTADSGNVFFRDIVVELLDIKVNVANPLDLTKKNTLIKDWSVDGTVLRNYRILSQNALYADANTTRGIINSIPIYISDTDQALFITSEGKKVVSLTDF